MAANQILFKSMCARVVRIDAVYRLWVIGNFLFRTMTTQLMRIVNPPAVSVLRIKTRVVVGTSTYFTYSVSHRFERDGVDGEDGGGGS